MTDELETALRTATCLRDAIAAEVGAARGERQLLRALDASGLFERAAGRAAFLNEAGRLERSLASLLKQVAARLGIGDVTIDRLRAAAPGRGTALADVLSEVRALAGALQEVDRLNLELARRALAIVRGYVEAVQPVPRAYDRFGSRSAAPALALVSSKG